MMKANPPPMTNPKIATKARQKANAQPPAPSCAYPAHQSHALQSSGPLQSIEEATLTIAVNEEKTAVNETAFLFSVPGETDQERGVE